MNEPILVLTATDILCGCLFFLALSFARGFFGALLKDAWRARQRGAR